MKKVMLMALALALGGCTTLSNLGKINRILPQVQRMVWLKNLKDVNPANENPMIEVCGQDDEELHELQAYANQLGWKEVTGITRADGKPYHQPHCDGLIYMGKP